MTPLFFDKLLEYSCLGSGGTVVQSPLFFFVLRGFCKVQKMNVPLVHTHRSDIAKVNIPREELPTTDFQTRH